MTQNKSKRAAPRAAARGKPAAATAADAALERIWAVVAALPSGTVTSYGEVAVKAGMPGRARLVGRALKVAPRALALPWHRVLTASGRPAFPPGTVAYQQQCRRLQREGVRFVNGRVVRATATSRAALDALLWDVAR